MEKLKGPNVEIVLSLNEGYDFTFLTSKFQIIASLNKSTIETNEFNGDKVVKFNSELIWATDKNNVKKLKNYKEPIRLDFFKLGDENKSKPFGYIIISLKISQYMCKDNPTKNKEERAKVCGLGKEAKGCFPELIFSLRIQDITKIEDLASARVHESNIEVTSRTSASLPNVDHYLKRQYICNKPVIEPEQAILDDVPKIDVCIKYQLDINFIRINWLNHYKDIHLRIHNSKAEVSWSAHQDIPETIPGTRTNFEDVTGRIVFISSPSEINSLLSESLSAVTICTNRNGRPQVLAKATICSPKLNEVATEFSADFFNFANGEKSAILVYSARIIDLGPQTCHQLAIEDDNPLAERMENELEIWKEKERKKFEEEYENKLKDELAKIHSVWTVKEQEFKDNAADKICKALSQELKKAIAGVKQKEKDLDIARAELEINYHTLEEETKIETECLRKNLLEKLKEKDKIILNLQNEIKSLKLVIQTNDSKQVLDAERVSNLFADLNKLADQLDCMKSSKNFFQEQWSRAVRELHKFKCEGWNDIQVQLNFRKEELRQLGLDQLINESDDNTESIEK